MIDIWSVPEQKPDAWFFGNIWTNDIRQAHELQIIQAGPSHKWWVSARLLLGLTEDQAREVHYKLTHETVYTIDGNTKTVVSHDVIPVKPISYIDKLLAR